MKLESMRKQLTMSRRWLRASAARRVAWRAAEASWSGGAQRVWAR